MDVGMKRQERRGKIKKSMRKREVVVKLSNQMGREKCSEEEGTEKYERRSKRMDGKENK
jgi:hypothetical protein